MKKRLGEFARGESVARLRASVVLLVASIFAGVVAWGAAGPGPQKQKKNGISENASAEGLPTIPNSVSDQIDHDIGEMLGAFQVGNVEAMHKYYADNATFASGSYEPPVVGWNNYVALYEKQKASFSGMQLIRRNTFIFVHQDVSWASYQWQFDSMFNGRPFMARGQTTLVLSKVGDNWLIVHNHTSEICPGQAPAAPQTQQTPQQQAPR
jgi:ketosteroid isomerase-like protein